jgi:hypothetical protein
MGKTAPIHIGEAAFTDPGRRDEVFRFFGRQKAERRRKEPMKKQ